MSKNKKLLIKFLILAIIFLDCLLIINAVYTHNVLQKKIIYQKDIDYANFLHNLPERHLQFAFFGDSHAEYALDLNAITSSYNFANSGETYIITYYKLKKILEEDKLKIDHFFLEIDPHTFSDSISIGGGISSNLRFFSEFIPFQDIKKIRSSDSVIKLLLEIYFPIFGQGDDFRMLLSKKELDIQKGSIFNFEKFTDSDINYSLNLAYINCFGSKNTSRINPLNLQYFLKTLKLIKRNNGTIIFIKYPLSKEFQNHTIKQNLSSEEYYTTLFININKTLESDYAILDYSNLLQNSSLFADPHHLNFNGAQIFSQKLLTDLQKF